MAPNLSLTRNKNKAPVAPKVVIKSDTENSESEAGLSDREDTLEKVTEPLTVSATTVIENITKQFVSAVEAPKMNGIASLCANADTVPSPPLATPVEITPLSNSGDTCSTNLPDTTTGENVTSPPVVTNGDLANVDTAVPGPVLTNGVDHGKGGSKVRVPGGRNKFRPNLSLDRSRHGSGPGSGGLVTTGSVSPRQARLSPVVATRSRTVSSSSTNSDCDLVTSSARQQPGPGPGDSPILRAAITTPRPARIRRTTESRSTLGDRTQFQRRKMDHKKKFSGGVPERGNLTMFDLIYYNPTYGQRMSVEDEDNEEVDDPDNPTVSDADQNDIAGTLPKKDDVLKNDDEEQKSEAIPVPQVKVGVNGEIIVDESSLQVETTQVKEAKIMMKNSALVFETNKTTNNYGRWSKKRRHNDWSKKETLKFFRALSVVGSDFSLMESIFKNRTRQELKLKFKKEERINAKMVDKCLTERGMFTELESLMKESEDDEAEEEEDEDFGKARSRPRKKRARRRYKNRGYYDSSSDGEDADVEASKSPVRKVAEVPAINRVKRPKVVNGRTADVAAAAAAAVRDQEVVEIVAEAVPLVSAPGAVLPGLAQFPPGLLAANPSLAGAVPGSLVVVAGHAHHYPSPATPLHVYMVPSPGPQPAPDTPPPPAAAPASPRPRPAPSTQLRLDPAVVRAVDRGRLSLSRQRTLSDCEAPAGGRKRTLSEMEAGAGGGEDGAKIGRVRQRTCSESGIETGRSEIRQRFLSGSNK